MRVSKQDLKAKEERVNSLLKKAKVKVAFRYNYVAIDLMDNRGVMVSTLVAGLTKAQAHEILWCIERVLLMEGFTWQGSA